MVAPGETRVDGYVAAEGGESRRDERRRVRRCGRSWTHEGREGADTSLWKDLDESSKSFVTEVRRDTTPECPVSGHRKHLCMHRWKRKSPRVMGRFTWIGSRIVLVDDPFV